MAHIDEAAPEDIPQLCDLLALLFAQEAEFVPDAARQTAGLSEIIARPEVGRILVLRQPAGVIGMVNLLFTVSTARGGRVALLEDMIVHPDHRGRGAGSALLRQAIACARDAGCSRITLLTDRVNAPALRFYQRCGFTPSEMLPLRLVLSD